MQSFLSFLVEQEITLQYHDELNPKLWKNNNLDQEVRKHLLKIAEFFRDFAKIPKEAIKDIIFTGGNANFNYTKLSDIDVHLVVDKKKLKVCSPEIMDDYLSDKKALCSLTHDIKVKGYPVELYAQGTDDKSSSDQGVFSLMQNKWIKDPKKVKVDYKDPYLQKKIKEMASNMEKFMKNKGNKVTQMKAYKEKIRSLRGLSLQKGGEFSLENLAFKELRNRGLIEKFSDYIKNIEDHELGLD
jgi:hypothetical protein